MTAGGGRKELILTTAKTTGRVAKSILTTAMTAVGGGKELNATTVMSAGRG